MPQRDRINAADQSAFMSLFGLSATSVMRAELLWDAENRLAAYIPLNQSGGAKKVTFKYDYRGRRIEKNVYAWNSGGSAWYTVPTERRRFVWNGWLMLRETIETDSASDGTFEATRVKTYTWGKDLGGGLESAGGIGGLLAVYDDSATSGSTGDDLAYVYMYDANGNVGQLCDLTESTAGDSIVAKYEYDAYGTPTVSTGSYASANTYRFSTKPWDDETGLGYWGYRYFDSRFGRWMSRDPANEAETLDLYAFVDNSPTRDVDGLGDYSAGLWESILPVDVLPQVVVPIPIPVPGAGVGTGIRIGSPAVPLGGTCPIPLYWDPTNTYPHSRSGRGKVRVRVYDRPKEVRERQSRHCRQLRSSYKQACKAGDRSCDGITHCWELRIRHTLNMRCYDLRLQYQKQCVISGGDQGHIDAINDAARAVNKCAEKYNDNSPKGPGGKGPKLPDVQFFCLPLSEYDYHYEIIDLDQLNGCA